MKSHFREHLKGPLSILALFTLLLYQNCDDIQKEASKLVGLDVEESLHKGLLLDGAELLGLDPQCESAYGEEKVLFYHSEMKLCLLSHNDCQSDLLSQRSFILASEEDCASYTRVQNSQEMSEFFESLRAADLGYQAAPDRVCTMDFEILVNIAQGQCAEASNGCENHYLREKKGFQSDPYHLCSSPY